MRRCFSEVSSEVLLGIFPSFINGCFASGKKLLCCNGLDHKSFGIQIIEFVKVFKEEEFSMWSFLQIVNSNEIYRILFMT